MSNTTLEKMMVVITDSPQSSQALLLFGLIKTLDITKGGHMYLLVKLKEMSEENRQLAYQLMELMANDQLHNDTWDQYVTAVEDIIRAG